MKKLTLFFLLLVSLISSQCLAQHDLLETEKMRFQVMIKQDTIALASILADDLIYTHSSGVTDGKKQILKSVGAGTYRAIEILDQKPIVWKNTGVIAGKIRVTIFSQQVERTFILKYQDVYRKEKNQWKMVAWQSLRVEN
ncbi:MAG: nuclear transport factor 2 family protein [Cyclobacteriaceae bacterium]|nr:nuclear transport factor 2 family protein [Cyclobacteriaceae bacterium]